MPKAKINKDSKAFKYYSAKKLGKNKKEAALVAGYSLSTATQPTAIENTAEYKAIEAHFKDSLTAKISLDEIADALIDNIKQPDSNVIDRGARNKAIEIALNKIEPEKIKEDIDEKVLIVLK